MVSGVCVTSSGVFQGTVLARVLAAADLALQLGLTLKINVVLIKGT